MEPLVIRSGQGEYRVDFFNSFPELVKSILENHVNVIVVDQNINILYGEVLKEILKSVPVFIIDATEEEKTLQGIEKVLSFFQESNLTRQSTVLAIGGGIIQDIVTFSSHIYYRGIRWMLVPTTLLSMGDSCIGAKCGINFKNHKNQLGIFQSPAHVFICPEFIRTLAERDVRSGYGEMLKLMLTGPQELYQNYALTLGKGFPSLAEAQKFIFESLKVKKQVIEEDEYEHDYRRILNFGHTFGHALESLTHYEIPHGSGVAWGVDLANYLSWKMGLLEEDYFKSIHAFIAEQFSFRLSCPIDVNALIRETKQDKKVTHGKANLVLLQHPGKLAIVPVEYDEQFTRLISEYFRDYNVIYWD